MLERARLGASAGHLCRPEGIWSPSWKTLLNRDLQTLKRKFIWQSKCSCTFHPTRGERRVNHPFPLPASIPRALLSIPWSVHFFFAHFAHFPAPSASSPFNIVLEMAPVLRSIQELKLFYWVLVSISLISAFPMGSYVLTKCWKKLCEHRLTV